MLSRKISVFARSSSSSSLVGTDDSLSPVSEKGHGSSHTHTRILGFELGFGVGAGASIVFFLLFLLFRAFKHKWKQNRASTAYLQSSLKLRTFTYSELKTATQGFDNEHKLGQGGFGAVYKGILKGGQEVAVKKLDVASSQGEREFQNELSVIGHVCVSPHIVRLVGFCSNGKKRLLVYEYMHNRSLQEALFDENYPDKVSWERRFDIIVDTCKALAFLHACKPPIIHGDIKPSNVLLDAKFCAKIADFGLARFKTGSKIDYDEEAKKAMYVVNVEKCKLKRQRRYVDKERKQKKNAPVVCAVDEETANAQPQLDLLSTECYGRQSVSSVFTTSPDSDASSSITNKPVCDFSQNSNDRNAAQHDLPSDSDLANSASHLCEVGSELLQSHIENCAGMLVGAIVHKPTQENAKSNIGMDNNAAQLEGEKLSSNNGKEVELLGGAWKEKRRSTFGRDWWWRQEMSKEPSVKDYVMDWMGYDSRKDALGSSNEVFLDGTTRPRKGQGERREHFRSSDLWGGSSQEEGGGHPISDNDLRGYRKKGERGKGSDARHWWKEDNSTSDASTMGIEVKPKDSVRTSRKSASLELCCDNATEDSSSLKRKQRSHKDRPKSREWWKDEEITNSKEWKASKKKREHSLSREWSGEICSKGVSSTPSMRGTICYVAPENGSNGFVSEKCDVYSFGVLLLVIISGRRPLQVMASPITEFERANLISWARHLAHSGSVLELVDPSLQGDFCRKQATLSITVALLCLQRLPSKRPSMNEVLKMLSGEKEAPSLPFQFSPSPPCRVPHRSRRRSLSSEGVTADFSVSS